MVNFPVSLDDNTTLFAVSNNLRTRLTSAINTSTLTIPVLTTSGFPTNGYITILTGIDITLAEAIRYTSTGATQFNATQRGADGTTAFAHNSGDNVDFTIVAAHHSALKDATIALEHFVGTSGSPNFVPLSSAGNAIIPNNLTVSGALNVSGTATMAKAASIGWLAVSGTVIGGGNFDFKNDGAVSGTLTVGEIPIGAVAAGVLFDLEEDTFSTTSTSYVDVTGSATTPLAVGDNLFIYSASAGGSAAGAQTVGLRCQFAGLDVGETVQNSYVSDGPYGVAHLGGFKIITGDGANLAKLQARELGGSNTASVSARSLLAIPFGQMGLVASTDYWFDNGSDSNTSVGTAHPTYTTVTTLNVTLPDAGDYIVFGSVEAGDTAGSPSINVRYQADGVTISTTYEADQLSTSNFGCFPFVKLQTFTVGAHTLTVQGAVDSGTANVRRARLCVVRAASFSQVVGVSSGSDQSTSSSTFSKVTSSEISYTPSQSETIVVLANPDGLLTSVTAPPSLTYKLVDETAAVDYMIDASPAKFENVADILPALMMIKQDNVTAAKTFSLSFREGESAGVTVTHNNVNMVVWSLTVGSPASPIQYTIIDGDGISAHDVVAVTGTFTDGLTVGSSTVHIYPDRIETPKLHLSSAYGNITSASGIVTVEEDFVTTGNATVSGNLDVHGNVGVSGSLAVLGDFSSTVGAFLQLTLSGVPVVTGTLTVRESDGSPSVGGVHTIVVTTGSLTNLGNGVVSVTTGGGGGGGGSLIVQEADGNPAVVGVSQIIVNNGSLVDNGSGSVTFEQTTVSGYPIALEKFSIRSTSRLKFAATTAFTDILSFTVPANTLGVGNILKARVFGYISNTVTGRSFEFAVNFGGKVFWGDDSGNFTAVADPRAFVLEAEILNCGNNEQRLSGRAGAAGAGATNSGIGNIGAAALYSTPLVGSGIVNTSTNQSFSFSMAASSAAGTSFTEVLGGYAEII